MRRSLIVFGLLISIVAFSSSVCAQATVKKTHPVQKKTNVGGRFEFGFHLGSWNVNMLKSPIESAINNLLRDNLSHKLISDIRANFPDAQIINYSQSLAFDSSGSNYGFDVRWYPSGFNGVFSVGFSLENTYMKFSFPTLDVQMQVHTAQYIDPLTFTPVFNSPQFELNPWSYHISFRWDILPSYVITPYITLGVGIFSTNYLYDSIVNVSYTGNLMLGSQNKGTYTGTYNKTVRELINEGSERNNIPGILPILQLNVGVKGKILDFVHVLADFGFWDGLMFRGGVAIRI